MQLLLRWVVTTVALYATVWILSLFGLARIDQAPWYAWFIAVVIMAGVNSLIRPIARLLTAPLNCLTFGLIGVVVNALLFLLIPWLAEQVGFPVFKIGFLGALIGSIVVEAIGGALSSLVVPKEEEG